MVMSGSRHLEEEVAVEEEGAEEVVDQEEEAGDVAEEADDDLSLVDLGLLYQNQLTFIGNKTNLSVSCRIMILALCCMLRKKR